MDVFRQYKLKYPVMESIKSESPYVSLYHQYLLNQFSISQQHQAPTIKYEAPEYDTEAPLDLSFKEQTDEELCKVKSPPVSLEEEKAERLRAVFG